MKFKRLDFVSVTIKGEQFYGRIRKIVVEETVSYYVQFHPNMEWVAYTEDSLEQAELVTWSGVAPPVNIPEDLNLSILEDPPKPHTTQRRGASFDDNDGIPF
jgi:hypothetical protein